MVGQIYGWAGGGRGWEGGMGGTGQLQICANPNMSQRQDSSMNNEKLDSHMFKCATNYIHTCKRVWRVRNFAHASNHFTHPCYAAHGVSVWLILHACHVSVPSVSCMLLLRVYNFPYMIPSILLPRKLNWTYRPVLSRPSETARRPSRDACKQSWCPGI